MAYGIFQLYLLFFPIFKLSIIEGVHNIPYKINGGIIYLNVELILNQHICKSLQYFSVFMNFWPENLEFAHSKIILG